MHALCKIIQKREIDVQSANKYVMKRFCPVILSTWKKGETKKERWVFYMRRLEEKDTKSEREKKSVDNFFAPSLFETH